jgi:hypothetical protein
MRGLSDRWLLSQPHQVVWAGWETNTWQLQQNGWQLSAEQSFELGRARILMKHPEMRIYAMSDAMSYDFFRQRDGAPVVFVCRHFVTEMVINDTFDLRMFGPIDARPQVVERHMLTEAEDRFKLFAPVLTRTEEIIVEPKTVQECLEHIRKLQAPELAAVRERNRTRDYRGSTIDSAPRQIVHAQILSLAA